MLDAAQTNTGEIGGLIRDASGGVLPGATVTLRLVAQGFSTERVTDVDWHFHAAGLPIGAWDVKVELEGFASHTERGVVLELGRTLNLDVVLKLAGFGEEITVSTDVPLLQTVNAEISDVIDNRRVLQMPLNGRSVLGLAQVSDGVVLPPGGTRGDALQQAGPLPNVGGQRSGHNTYLLDGAKVTDELFNNLAINPSVDSIQEFRIQKSMYPAEFGGKASALINVATKSGGNTPRGSVFEFLRDNRFDAHNYFDPNDAPVPPLGQHQFGGTLGGPLVRNRTFFFFSYEGGRTRRSLTRTFSVPTLELRRGDFAGLSPLCDPVAPGAATGVCAPFGNNMIPAERIDPIAAAFLQHVPLPTAAGLGRNLTSVEEQNKNVDQFSLRADHRLTAADQIFGRFSTFDADELQPFGTSALQETLVPGFGRTLGTRTRNLSASETHVMGSRCSTSCASAG